MRRTLEFADSTSHIKLDLFPGTLYLGTIGGEDNEIVHTEVRIIVTNDYIYGISMGPSGPEFVLKEELVDFAFYPKLGYMISGANRDYVAVRDGNCGCGTRLRGMRFLPGVGHVKMKTINT